VANKPKAIKHINSLRISFSFWVTNYY